MEVINISLACNKSKIELIAKVENDLVDKALIASCFAVVRDETKILLGYNKYRQQWELPAGKIEKGETLKQAVYRELYEETGQRSVQLQFKAIFQVYDNKQKEYRYRGVFEGEIKQISAFIKNEETEKIIFWDGIEDIGYIDEVDLKMLEML